MAQQQWQSNHLRKRNHRIIHLLQIIMQATQVLVVHGKLLAVILSEFHVQTKGNFSSFLLRAEITPARYVSVCLEEQRDETK